MNEYDPLWMADMAAIARRAYAHSSGKMQPGVRYPVGTFQYTLTSGDDLVIVERQMVRTVRGQVAAIVVSCKGTATVLQWVSNLRIRMAPAVYGGAKIHPGFWQVAEALVSAVADAIRTIDGTMPVFVTGHSRGGAIGKCLAFLLNKSVGISGVATFGCPRVGDAQWAALYNVSLLPRTWAAVNHNDVVARLPAWRWGYRHCGRPVYIDRKGLVHPDANMGRVWLDRLIGRVVALLQRKRFDGIRDHMALQYAGKLSSVATDFEEQSTPDFEHPPQHGIWPRPAGHSADASATRPQEGGDCNAAGGAALTDEPNLKGT